MFEMTSRNLIVFEVYMFVHSIITTGEVNTKLYFNATIQVLRAEKERD
jgi:hypothetical protein